MFTREENSSEFDVACERYCSYSARMVSLSACKKSLLLQFV